MSDTHGHGRIRRQGYEVVITRDERGVFEAHTDDGRFVRGWAPTVEQMAVVLRRYGHAGTDLTGPGVSTVTVEGLERVRACMLDDGTEQWDQRLRAAADAPQRQELREGLSQLRSRIPADPQTRRAWLAEHTDAANRAAPQVATVAVFHGGAAVRCQAAPDWEPMSECLHWVDPRAVLSTPDRVWGEFDRMESHRRSLDSLLVSLRAAESEAALQGWIDDFVIGRLAQPVQLIRVEGPGGPVYEVRADGTHRTHFARVFGLPLLALVKTCAPPRRLILVDHPDRPEDGALGEGFGRFASLWAGLRDRGLIEFDGDPEPDWLASWTPTRFVAEWMLLAPTAATVINRAYDRAYPGALHAATGLTDQQLFDPQTWTDLLIGDRPMVNIFLNPPAGAAAMPPRGARLRPPRPLLDRAEKPSWRDRLRRWSGGRSS